MGLGVVLIPCFYIWEAKFAPIQFLPFKYLKQGTIIGSCVLNAIMFLSTFTWNAYFGSYLQVVNRQSITNANYILNAYSLTSSVFAPLHWMIISYTGNFKWTAYVGVPIMLLGTALIIPLRDPDTNPGVLAFTQILVGLGAGIFSTTAQIAVMAPVTHQYLAVANALQGLFGGVGSSIGYAIAGALWNNILPKELYKRLPESSKADAHVIFGDFVLAQSFADGTPEREAIVASYAHIEAHGHCRCLCDAAVSPGHLHLEEHQHPQARGGEGQADQGHGLLSELEAPGAQGGRIHRSSYLIRGSIAFLQKLEANVKCAA